MLFVEEVVIYEHNLSMGKQKGFDPCIKSGFLIEKEESLKMKILVNQVNHAVEFYFLIYTTLNRVTLEDRGRNLNLNSSASIYVL